MSKLTENDVRHLNGADFLIVTEDRNFFTNVSMFSLQRKDVGKTKAEQIHRKLTKKLNSVKVLSLSEASAPLLRKVLYPTAKINSIYRRHPTDKTKYFGVSNFHEMLLDEMRHELYSVFRSVGAKSMVWKDHKLWNKSYMSPDTIQPGILDEQQPSDQQQEFKFFRDNRTWHDAVQERLQDWSDTLNVEFAYTEDFLVNDRVIDTVLEKLEVPKELRFQTLGLAKLESEITSSKSSRFTPAYGLFETTKECVSIEFFGREDYKDTNVKWIRKSWDTRHVQAFLEIIGLRGLVSLFKEQSVNGKQLLAMNTTSLLRTFFGDEIYSESVEEDADQLIGSINELGDLDFVDILTRVTEHIELTFDELQKPTPDLSLGNLLRFQRAPTVVSDSSTYDVSTRVSSSSGAPGQGQDQGQYHSTVGPSISLMPSTSSPTFSPSAAGIAAAVAQASQGKGNDPGYSYQQYKRNADEKEQQYPPRGMSHSPQQLSPTVGIGIHPQYGGNSSNFSPNANLHRMPSEDEKYDISEYHPSNIPIRGGSVGLSPSGGLVIGSGPGSGSGHFPYSQQIQRNMSSEVDTRPVDISRQKQQQKPLTPAASSFKYISDGDKDKDRGGGVMIDDGVSVMSDSGETNVNGIKGGANVGYRNVFDFEEQEVEYGDEWAPNIPGAVGIKSGKVKDTDVNKTTLVRDVGREQARENDYISSKPRKDGECLYKVSMVGIKGVGKKRLMRRLGTTEFTTSDIIRLAAKVRGRAGVIGGYGDLSERFAISNYTRDAAASLKSIKESRSCAWPTGKADILFVVYDMTDSNSFQVLPGILKQVLSGAGATPWISISLLGNKCDKEGAGPDLKRQVTQTQAQELCRSQGITFFAETSAKTSHNVDEILLTVLESCEQDRMGSIFAGGGPAPMQSTSVPMDSGTGTDYYGGGGGGGGRSNPGIDSSLQRYSSGDQYDQSPSPQRMGMGMGMSGRFSGSRVDQYPNPNPNPGNSSNPYGSMDRFPPNPSPHMKDMRDARHTYPPPMQGQGQGQGSAKYDGGMYPPNRQGVPVAGFNSPYGLIQPYGDSGYSEMDRERGVYDSYGSAERERERDSYIGDPFMDPMSLYRHGDRGERDREYYRDSRDRERDRERPRDRDYGDYSDREYRSGSHNKSRSRRSRY